MQAFHNDKKKVFDISKVPDIYDSAKYDAIHNAELGLKIEPLYKACLANTSSLLPQQLVQSACCHAPQTGSKHNLEVHQQVAPLPGSIAHLTAAIIS